MVWMLLAMMPVEEPIMTSSSSTMQPDQEPAEWQRQQQQQESVYTRSVHYRRARKRIKIFKTVHEAYLRHDLGLGCHFVMQEPQDRRQQSQLQQQQAVEFGDDGDDNDKDKLESFRNQRRQQMEESVVGKPQVIENVDELLRLLQPPPPSSTLSNKNNNNNNNNSSNSNSTALLSLIICDTNVLLHSLDLLEQANHVLSVMPNLVIPQTALEECRHVRHVAYERAVNLLRSVSTNTTSSAVTSTSNARNRCCNIFFPDSRHAVTAVSSPQTNSTKNIKSMAPPPPPSLQSNSNSNNNDNESINDTNDARIRRVAAHFGQQLQGTNVRVILLTDDAASRARAQQEQMQKNPYYEARSVRSWVQELERQHPGISSLSDLVAQHDGSTAATAAVAGGSAVGHHGKEQFVPSWTPHLSATELSLGMQTGLHYRGVFRSSPMDTTKTGMVMIRQGEERVAVTMPTIVDANRAIDGDVVVIALYPVEHWISSSSTSNTTRSKEKADTQQRSSGADCNDAGDAGIASETAEPSQGDLENVPEEFSLEEDDDGSNSASQASPMRPTGKVVGIVRRNFSSYSGSIFEATRATAKNEAAARQSKKSDDTTTQDIDWTDHEQIAARHERAHADGSVTCVFFPVDKKVPPILIRTTQRDRLLSQRIIVAMDSWPVHSPYPLGHYVQTLGPSGSKDVETLVLLKEHDIPHGPFPAAVLACLPPADYKIADNFNPHDVDPGNARTDLRHLPVLSIDPPGCKDIDDALHCMLLPNGNYQVGVHIADVTHYVKPGTAIDMEAASRSTSTYLVNKRLDMLPTLLTTDLCSLKGNVDRFAFSVLWEVTPDANIIDVEFKKTIIHSIGALTYQQAQSFIDQPDDPSDIQACAVKGLAVLAKKFRKRRIDAGALTLASPEVKFVLDSESLNPTDVQAYALLEANALVEEFMLLANVTVAKKILRHYPTLSVLRRHPAPNRAMFDSLISKANSRGLSIDIEDSKRLADSLEAAIVPEDAYVNKLLRILSTRCMSPAQYFCSGEYRATEWHHYGLAAPVYTHFTSPIRRYADVCVHRLLAAAIGVAPLPQHLSSKSYLHDLCANMNRRHRAAQLAGRASVQLHTLIFFAGDDDADEKEGSSSGTGGGDAKEEDAYVLDVDTADGHDPSFTVMVPRYGIEGRVKIPVVADDPNLERNALQHKLIYKQGDQVVSVQVFDKVRVRIWVKEVQEHQRKLVLDLLEPKFDSKSNSSSDDKLDVDRRTKRSRVEE
jgi:exosome complex exonuclease DIS3/RRP44